MVPKPPPPIAGGTGTRVERALQQAESFRKIDAPGFTGGAIDKIPGLSHIQAYLRPANKLPPKVQNAWVASGGERAAFLTDQFPSRSRIFQRIDELFGARATVDESGRVVKGPSPVEGGKTNVRFIGPESERVGIEGTILDIAQRPQFYDLTDEMQSFLAGWQVRQSKFQQDLIQGYEAKVGEFIPAQEGSVFLSNVDVGDEMLVAMQQTEGQALRQGRFSTRTHETAANRMQVDPDFSPILDIRKLQSGMDESRAAVAGNEVFRQGIGGETRVEAVGRLHPDLLKLKNNLTNRVRNLRNRINTAERQITTAGTGINRTSTELNRVMTKAEPLTDRIEALGLEWGPELSFLSGQVRELLQQAARLERSGVVLTERVVGKTSRPLIERVSGPDELFDIRDVREGRQRKERWKIFFKGTDDDVGPLSVTGALNEHTSLARARSVANQLASKAENNPSLRGGVGNQFATNELRDEFERRGVGVRSVEEASTGLMGKRQSLITELDNTVTQLERVRRKYDAADLRPLRLQKDVFRYLPADEAKAVTELSLYNTSHWVAFLDNIRGTAYSADLSPIAGVQLPLHMLFQPHRAVPRLVGAGKSSAQSKDLLKVFRESTMAKVVEDNPQAARDFAFYSGIPVQTGTITEFSGGFLRMINPTIFGKRVAFGEKFQIFNERMFTLAMRQSLDTFSDVTRRLGNSGVFGDDAKVVAADMATKVIPVWNPHRLGLSRTRAAAIRALPTSVSFLLRPAALIGEATTGFAKIGLKQTLTPQEKMAVQLMTTAAGSVMALTTSSAAADALSRGNDPIQAIKDAVDPNSPKFARLFISGTGRSVPLGGPFRGILKVIFPREVDWAPVPVPFANIFNFALARTNPFIATQIRQLKGDRGKDFFGGDIRKGEFPEQVLRGLAYEIEGSIPLTGGSAISGVRRGLDPSDIAEEAGAQFLGSNIGQETPFQQQDLAAQRWAKEQGIEGEVFQLNINGETVEAGKSGKIESFYDFSPSDRRKFEAEHPGIVAARKEETERRAKQGISFAETRQEAEDLKEESMKFQLADDDLVINGDISASEWREKRGKRRDSLNDKRDQLYSNIDTREPETVMDHYFAEFDRIKTRFNDVMTDDAWQELEFWIESQPVETQEFIDANTGLAPMTPLEEEYKRDLATLHPYFDIRDFVVRTLQSSDAELAVQYQEWLDAGPGERASIQRSNPKVAEIVNSTVPGLQLRMRSINSPENAEIDRLLRKWEFSTSQPRNPANLQEFIGAP